MSAFELEDFFDVVRLPDERFATIKLPLINFDCLFFTICLS